METKPHQLFMSPLTPLPRFYKCHQIHALWFMVNKGKMKGGRCLPSLTRNSSWKRWISSQGHAFCSLWDLFFSRLYLAKEFQRPKPPRCRAIGQTSKPSSAQQIRNCSSQPTARQDGFGPAPCAPHVLLLPAAPASCDGSQSPDSHPGG